MKMEQELEMVTKLADTLVEFAVKYGFIKQSIGHVTIQSEAGRGTTVDLYLPRSRDEIMGSDNEDDRLEAARGSERILVVEDDPEWTEWRSCLGLGHAFSPAEASGQKRRSISIAWLFEEPRQVGWSLRRCFDTPPRSQRRAKDVCLLQPGA